MLNKYVTIIIPVYKDWDRLSLCLNALVNQTYAKETFEIFLVNNNPEEDVPNGYFIPSNCSVITESKPGSYAARNAALKLAKGEIIGFTDSDCIPDSNWIKNAVEYFSENVSCSRIAGKVSIFFKNANPTKAELYDKLYGFNQSRSVLILGTSVTANLFTYKHVFDKVGLFDENLLSGGDFSWGMLAQKAGYSIDYVRNVIVNHPARYSFKDLIRKEKRIGGGHGISSKNNETSAVNFFRFLKTLWPNIAELKYVYRQAEGESINNKIYFLFIRHCLHSIRAYEKFMVQRGRKPKRD